MALLEIILLVVLLIPIFAVFTNSPLGRALARRVEGAHAPPPEVAELAGRIDSLENEVEDLTRSVATLKEANQFFQRLLEEGAGKPPLPKPPAP